MSEIRFLHAPDEVVENNDDWLKMHGLSQEALNVCIDCSPTVQGNTYTSPYGPLLTETKLVFQDHGTHKPRRVCNEAERGFPVPPCVDPNIPIQYGLGNRVVAVAMGGMSLNNVAGAIRTMHTPFFRAEVKDFWDWVEHIEVRGYKNTCVTGCKHPTKQRDKTACGPHLEYAVAAFAWFEENAPVCSKTRVEEVTDFVWSFCDILGILLGTQGTAFDHWSDAKEELLQLGKEWTPPALRSGEVYGPLPTHLMEKYKNA